MDIIDIHGKMTIHELPDDWTDEELRYWWEPETVLGDDGLYHIVRPSRMREGEKRSRIVCEAENLITNTGMATLLNNLSVVGQGNMQAFAQIFSVGNGAVTNVLRTDTAVAGDAFGTNCRKVPASFSIVGFQTTITINYASGDAQSVWTNAGLYGFKVSGAQNATTTGGTGALMTHVLFAFSKGAVAYAVAYVLTISN